MASVITDSDQTLIIAIIGCGCCAENAERIKEMSNGVIADDCPDDEFSDDQNHNHGENCIATPSGMIQKLIEVKVAEALAAAKTVTP